MTYFSLSAFRGGTNDDYFSLSVLTSQHPSYASLKQQFFSKWKKPINSLTVEEIFRAQVGVNLNYDEVTAYNENAVLPSYLIVYSMIP